VTETEWNRGNLVLVNSEDCREGLGRGGEGLAEAKETKQQNEMETHREANRSAAGTISKCSCGGQSNPVPKASLLASVILSLSDRIRDAWVNKVQLGELEVCNFPCPPTGRLRTTRLS